MNHSYGDLSQHADAVLINNVQKFEGHAAGLLSAGFPFLYGRLACVQVHGKGVLTNICTLSDLFNLQGLINGRFGATRPVKFTHGCIVYGAHSMQG
jgi:hypothetical protein